MAFLMIGQRQKQVYSWRESLIWRNRRCEFRTVVCKVSSFVGNIVFHKSKHSYSALGCTNGNLQPRNSSSIWFSIKSVIVLFFIWKRLLYVWKKEMLNILQESICKKPLFFKALNFFRCLANLIYKNKHQVEIIL